MTLARDVREQTVRNLQVRHVEASRLKRCCRHYQGCDIRAADWTRAGAHGIVTIETFSLVPVTSARASTPASLARQVLNAGGGGFCEGRVGMTLASALLAALLAPERSTQGKPTSLLEMQPRKVEALFKKLEGGRSSPARCWRN